jgi:hypothetical protein
MRTDTWNRHSAAGPALGLVALGLLLAGCGGSSDEARQRHETAQSGGTVANAQSDDPTADMVNAVGSADGKPPVYLKFRLVTAPQVGQPLELQVALVQDPKFEIDSLKVWLQPREGLQLKSPSPIDYGKPGVGESHMIPVTLVPQQNGVLSLGITVLVDTERESLTRSYTVPVLVLAPQPVPVDPKAAASVPPAARIRSR